MSFLSNQFNDEYLAVCKELEIQNFRGNPRYFIYKARKREEESPKIRLLRFLDAYINISGNQLAEITQENGLLNIPATRLLRPYIPKI